MAHEVETMFSGRSQKPWHFSETGRTGQTVVVDHAPNAAEAIRLAQLDWRVDLKPVVFLGPDGETHQVPDRFAVVRDSDLKPIEVVGSHYVPLQNEDAFQFLDNLVDEGLEYETAGSLRGGETVFITAKLPNDILIGGEDAHQLYLFIRNSHNGRDAVNVGVTPIRIVCQNTMNLALRNTKRFWSAAHVSTMQGRLQDAREALDLTWKYVAEFEELGEQLLGLKLTDSAFDDFLEACLKAGNLGPRAMESADSGIRSLYRHSATVGDYRGTGWGALNAVGEYFDWMRDTRSDEARLLGSLEGVSAKMRDAASRLLVAAC